MIEASQKKHAASGMTPGELQHDRRVLGQHAVVRVQERHQLGLGPIDAEVPVLHHPEVVRIPVVGDPRIAEGGHQLLGPRLLSGVVAHQQAPFGAALGQHALDGHAEVFEPPVEGDREGELRLHRLHHRVRPRRREGA